MGSLMKNADLAGLDGSRVWHVQGRISEGVAMTININIDNWK